MAWPRTSARSAEWSGSGSGDAGAARGRSPPRSQLTHSTRLPTGWTLSGSINAASGAESAGHRTVVTPDRKSTRLNSKSPYDLVCRLLLEKKKEKLGDLYVQSVITAPAEAEKR